MPATTESTNEDPRETKTDEQRRNPVAEETPVGLHDSNAPAVAIDDLQLQHHLAGRCAERRPRQNVIEDQEGHGQQAGRFRRHLPVFAHYGSNEQHQDNQTDNCDVNRQCPQATAAAREFLTVEGVNDLFGFLRRIESFGGFLPGRGGCFPVTSCGSARARRSILRPGFT